eukprot:4383573-Pyramimonas_sp.AAC.1
MAVRREAAGEPRHGAGFGVPRHPGGALEPRARADPEGRVQRACADGRKRAGGQCPSLCPASVLGLSREGDRCP